MTALAFAAVRIVRLARDDLTPPDIVLPPGWSAVADAGHAVTSECEHYRFLCGPRGSAGTLIVTWPGSRIVAAVHDGRRLRLDVDGQTVRIDVPLSATSAREAWTTIEIHSHLDERDLPLRIEHNHPGRCAGWYRDHPWVDGPARAMVNYLFAARTMLRDWGIHHRIAAAGAGRIELLGFESNNPLHGDAPPHWHLVHYLPDDDGRIPHDAPGTQIPHFYLDALGRVVSNQQDIMKRSDLSRRLGVGEAMRFYDRSDATLFTMTIADGGGVVVRSPTGASLYELKGMDGDARDQVQVLRRGDPWATVRAHDDSGLGRLDVRVECNGTVESEIWTYDPLLGRASGDGLVSAVVG